MVVVAVVAVSKPWIPDITLKSENVVVDAALAVTSAAAADEAKMPREEVSAALAACTGAAWGQQKKREATSTAAWRE